MGVAAGTLSGVLVCRRGVFEGEGAGGAAIAWLQALVGFLT